MKLRPIAQTTVALACLLPVLSSFALAQDPLHANPLDVGVPSPTAASIANSALSDVSHETGALQLTIPLAEVTSRSGLTVPITLEYSSTGVKVDELAGWVGMGWTLKAGGAVIRTVRGLPDETDQQGYPFTRHRLDPPGVWHGDFETGYGSGPLRQLIKDLHAGFIDTQPDLYVFSAPGLSGRFVWIGPETFSLVPHQAITIHPLGGHTVWSMTGPDGTRYTFGSPVDDAPIETTQSDELGASPVISAWYLTRMEPANGSDAITFEYQRQTAQAAHGVFHERVIINQGPLLCFEQLGSDKESMQNTTTQTPVLHKIVSDDIEVLFISSSQGVTDIDFHNQERTFNQAQLDAIEVRHQGQLVRRVDLAYEMIQSVAYGNQSGRPNLSKRLYLVSLAESGPDGLQLPPYRFEYHHPDYLPPRLSYSQDHWGYANGAGNNTLLPPDAVREPNASAARYGTLTRVTFPTGGYEVYVWGGGERLSHAGQNVPSGGMRVEKRSTYPDSGSPPIVREYRYRLADGEGPSSGLAMEAVYEQEFVITSVGCAGKVRTAHSQVTLGSGGATTYREVAVLEGEEGALGRTVYRYYVDGDTSDEGYGGIPGAETNWGWRSALIEERAFNAEGQMVLQRKHLPAQLVELPAVHHDEWRALAARILKIETSQTEDIYALLFYRKYHVISGWPRLKETTEFRN